jgi:hypothetical protein
VLLATQQYDLKLQLEDCTHVEVHHMHVLHVHDGYARVHDSYFWLLHSVLSCVVDDGEFWNLVAKNVRWKIVKSCHGLKQ